MHYVGFIFFRLKFLNQLKNLLLIPFMNQTQNFEVMQIVYKRNLESESETNILVCKK